MPPFTPYAYRADISRFVDADTFDVVFDLGFGIRFDEQVRLKDIDTAEIYGTAKDSDEYQRGMAHLQFVEDWFAAACDDAPVWPVYAFTYQDRQGKYGRYLADFAPRADPDALLSEALRAEFGDEVTY